MNEEFEKFVEAVKKALEERFPDKQIQFHDIIKTNDVELKGVCILESGKNMAPMIYLNNYYETYKEGIDISTIVDNIVLMNNMNKDTLSAEQDDTLKNLYDFEKIKDKIGFRIINRDENKKLLEQTPHKNILSDYAMIYYIKITDIAVCRIKNEALKKWEVGLEKIDEVAKKNMPRLYPPRIDSVVNFLSKISGYPVPESDFDDVMFVVTNEQKINGAGTIFYQNVLRDFSEQKQCDFFILPSSVNEMILVRDDKKSALSTDILISIVKEMNETEVSKDDFLGDRVYRYSRERDLIYENDYMIAKYDFSKEYNNIDKPHNKKPDINR